MEKSEMEASEEPLAQPLFWWWKHLLCSFDQQVLTVPNFTPFICMINGISGCLGVDRRPYFCGTALRHPHMVLAWGSIGSEPAGMYLVCYLGHICHSPKDPKERCHGALIWTKEEATGVPQATATSEHQGAYRIQSPPSEMPAQQVMVDPRALDFYQPSLLLQKVRMWGD